MRPNRSMIPKSCRLFGQDHATNTWGEIAIQSEWISRWAHIKRPNGFVSARSLDWPRCNLPVEPSLCETVSVSGKRNSESRDTSAKIRRRPLLVSAETRPRRRQVPAREHSTHDQLDPRRKEPYEGDGSKPCLERKDVPMNFIKSLRLVLLGVAMAAATLSSVEPVSALGGCGANRHRNAWGRCVWGGQNEDWCLRKTGHRATYVGRGVWRCFR